MTDLIVETWVHSWSRCCCEYGRVRRAVGPLLAVTVALVLADSAVVTLALPDILRELDARCRRSPGC